MCLIIKKPPGRTISADFLVNAHSKNNHGWGFFFLDDGRPVWQRGMHLDDLLEANRRLPEHAEVYVHLRQATYGDVVEDMAHPFVVRQGLLLMHNGSLHSLAPEDAACSDTFELARLLNDLTRGLNDDDAARLLRSEGFARLTAPLIHGSMIVLLDKAGVVCLGRAWHTLSAQEWDDAMCGMEVSNTHAWVARNQQPSACPAQVPAAQEAPVSAAAPRTPRVKPARAPRIRTRLQPA
jgi:hypothetical protein